MVVAFVAIKLLINAVVTLRTEANNEVEVPLVANRFVIKLFVEVALFSAALIAKRLVDVALVEDALLTKRFVAVALLRRAN